MTCLRPRPPRVAKSVDVIPEGARGGADHVQCEAQVACGVCAMLLKVPSRQGAVSSECGISRVSHRQSTWDWDRVLAAPNDAGSAGTRMCVTTAEAKILSAKIVLFGIKKNCKS